MAEQTAAETRMLNAALAYVQRLGWHVHPLKPGTKEPATEHGLLDATTDERQIARWWRRWPDANIAVNCGRSGLAVPDLDTKGGQDGPGTWRRLLDERGITAPNTNTNLTPSGGEHELYRLPAGVSLPSDNTGRIAPGVDLKSAGGYIVLPPSTLAEWYAEETGCSPGVYAWELSSHPLDVPPAEMPPAMVALLQERLGTSRDNGHKERYRAPDIIPEGRRNTELHRMACSLRARGLSQAGILAAVIAENLERCTPPLDDDELETIVNSACRYPPGTSRTRTPAPTVATEPPDIDAEPPDAGPIHNTDLGNARRFAIRHGNRARYCENWTRWLLWDGTRWAPDGTLGVVELAKHIPRMLYAEAASIQDDDIRKERIRFALRSESATRIRAMLDLARSERAIATTPDVWDQDAWLLNVQNGTIDLRTGALQAHNPGDNITKLAPADYHPDAKCPQFQAFLQDVMNGDDEMIAFLQRAIGYSLSGDTSERVLFICHGTGNNGKTTLLEAIRDTLGDYALRTPTSTLLTTRNDTVPNDVARLKGARFVSACESEEGRRLAESVVKDITGQDTISARFMRAEWFDFKPECKLWLATNDKPRIRGTDNAIWNRIRLVPFNVTIPDDEINPHLGDELQTERAGILAWAVRGCLEWQEHRLDAPSAVTDATKEYRAEMDVLADFLDDYCIEAPDAFATSKALHTAFLSWCEKNGERGMSKTMMGKRLATRGYQQDRDTTGARGWRGVGLLSTEREKPKETT